MKKRGVQGIMKIFIQLFKKAKLPIPLYVFCINAPLDESSSFNYLCFRKNIKN
jgi:hypothetical protein